MNAAELVFDVITNPHADPDAHGTYTGPTPPEGALIVYRDRANDADACALARRVVLDGGERTRAHFILAQPVPYIYACPFVLMEYSDRDAFADHDEPARSHLYRLTDQLARNAAGAFAKTRNDRLERLSIAYALNDAGGLPAMQRAACLACLRLGRLESERVGSFLNIEWHGIGDWVA